MNTDILFLLGGIGLFLVGMQMMTGALRALAGRQLRHALARFTRTPFTGALTGAIATAVIQSSSATTVTTVGFVGAGLLGFGQALGIVFGASVGTTFTGWMVMFLGIKLPLGLAAYGILFLAALAQILTEGRKAQVATALAGFALIFVGIDTLVSGMPALQTRLGPEFLPADTLGGRLLLVGLGVVITVVTQSSSAGVAMAVVAVASGSIGFGQGAALVVGMHVGTSFTAILATVGGSRAMRQTGFAHLLFNLASGLMGFALLDLFAIAAAPLIAAGDAPLALVLFHTGFNLLGVAVMLPLARQFAAVTQWLIPETDTTLTDVLDPRLHGDPAAALDAAGMAMGLVARQLLSDLADMLAPPLPGPAPRRAPRSITLPLDQLHDWLARVPHSEDPRIAERRQALLHGLDHLLRLAHRAGQHDRIRRLEQDRTLARLARVTGQILHRSGNGTGPEAGQGDTMGQTATRLSRLFALMLRHHAQFRARALARAARGRIDADMGFQLMDSMRWLERSCHHAERILHHLSLAAPASATARADDPDTQAPVQE